MRDIIERAMPLRKAKYVCMEGADKLVSIPTYQGRPLLKLTAQWLLWHICEVKLGDGPEPWNYACTQNER